MKTLAFTTDNKTLKYIHCNVFFFTNSYVNFKS